MKPLFQIKICGITRANDALEAFFAGADAIGLNFYPASKRYVDDLAASTIVAAVLSDTRLSRKRPQIVGVFVNSSPQQIVQKVVDHQLNGIQLHGDEDRDFLRKLMGILKKVKILDKNRSPLLIKAMRPNLGGSSTRSLSGNPEGAESFRSQSAPNGLLSLIEEIEQWKGAGADAVLLDAPTDGSHPNQPPAVESKLPQVSAEPPLVPLYGGTGHAIDWKTLTGVEFSLPYVLAGGLKPENVAEAIAISGARSVDVASGVEIAPGIKSGEKVRNFVTQTGWRSV